MTWTICIYIMIEYRTVFSIQKGQEISLKKKEPCFIKSLYVTQNFQYGHYQL